jgi:hypothetical protein
MMFQIEGLEEILNDPIQCNLTMCQLPSVIRQQLMHERKYVFSFFAICENLCRFGLLSFGTKNFKVKSQVGPFLLAECFSRIAFSAFLS